MADDRFFQRAGPFTLGDLAAVGECELATPDLADRVITDTGTLSDARADDVTFLDNRKYVAALRASSAGACVLHPRDVDNAPAGMGLLVSKTPYRSFALIVQAFYPRPVPAGSRHPSAVIDETASVGEGTQIDAGVVIGAGATVGAGCHIAANAVIGPGVTVGDRVRIGPGASLEYCAVGNDTQIHAGARIGTRGFGFAMDARGHVELPQIGRVVIGNDVEIGANTTVDRGMGPDTVIGDGTKIDNLVQIAHNVVIGKHCVIAGQAGIAGSAVLEDFVVVAATSGVIGHIRLGAGTRVAGMSGVVKSTPPGATVAGIPASDHRDWLRKNALIENLLKKHKEKRDG